MSVTKDAPSAGSLDVEPPRKRDTVRRMRVGAVGAIVMRPSSSTRPSTAPAAGGAIDTLAFPRTFQSIAISRSSTRR